MFNFEDLFFYVDLKILDQEFYKQFDLPKYETTGSAGVDLRANITNKVLETAKYPVDQESINILPKENILIPTGIAIHIKRKDVVGVICPRSGLGHKHGIVLGNTIGIIDSDYQGELHVSLLNRKNEIFNVKRGDRIAQLVFLPVLQAKFNIVNDFDESTRGTNGFGHTGR
jgi:dUTP pyrophosphatase